MKRVKISIILSVIIIMVMNLSSYAATNNGKPVKDLDESILIESENDVENKSISIERLNFNNTDFLNIEQVNGLKSFGFNIDDAEFIDIISNKDKTYKKILVNDKQYICVDENNKVFNICNIKPQNSKSINRFSLKSDFDKVAKQVSNYYELDKSYELVKTEGFDEDYWNITLMRRLDNGVLNPYESINVTISKSDLSIVFLNYFNEKTDSLDPKITDEEAILVTKEFLNEIEEPVDDVTLCYIHPNLTEEKESQGVKLAYKIAIDEANIIYVDAISGDIIGNDIIQSETECAGSYGQTNSGLKHSGDRVDLAADGFISLGYSPCYTKKLDTSSLRTYVQNHINRDNAYAFYFCGHGTSSDTDPRISIKKKDYDAILYSSEVEGNWHFVFLDACHTGRSIWAEAFNITNSHKNRAFLGWDGKVYASNLYDFEEKFWPLMGTMSIRDAAVNAASQVAGDGTTPIRFFGDSSYYGAPL